MSLLTRLTRLNYGIKPYGFHDTCLSEGIEEIKRLTSELSVTQTQLTEAKEREDVDAIRIHLFDEENDSLRQRAESAERERDLLKADIEGIHLLLDTDESKIIRNHKDGYPEGRPDKLMTLEERVSSLCKYANDWKRWFMNCESDLLPSVNILCTTLGIAERDDLTPRKVNKAIASANRIIKEAIDAKSRLARYEDKLKDIARMDCAIFGQPVYIAREALKEGGGIMSIEYQTFIGRLQDEIDRLTAENTKLECLNADYAAKIATLKADLRDSGIALKDAIASIQSHKAEITALENAEWLTTAHTICSDMGIPNGHIKDRMCALRDKLERQNASGMP